jgi:hypothetical protein
MKKKAVVWALFLMSGAMVPLSILAQSEKHVSQRVLLEKRAPGVYITSVGTYTSDYKAEGESGKRAVLQLHNNYRFTIEVAVYNVEDEPIFVGNKKMDVVGVVYDLDSYSEESEKQPTKRMSQEVLTGISLDSGESLMISVPFEHVTKDSEIRVPFQIAEESRSTIGGSDPQHFAVFMGKFMQDSEGKKK